MIAVCVEQLQVDGISRPEWIVNITQLRRVRRSGYTRAARQVQTGRKLGTGLINLSFLGLLARRLASFIFWRPAQLHVTVLDLNRRDALPVYHYHFHQIA
jgi:hypothetical protein